MFKKAYSCSHKISSEMPLWPDDPSTTFTGWADFDRSGYFLRAFSMGEHSGTHVNAPSSFLAGAQDIADVAAAPLVFPLAVIDISAKVSGNPDAALEIEDVTAWEGQFGKIPCGTFVAVHTGWDKLWHSPARYMGVQADGSMRFPSISFAAAQLLVEQRKVAGLGIDTHGIDSPEDEKFRCNTTVLKNCGVVVECLCNLGELPVTGATIVVGALQLVGGSGSPAAVTVLV